MKRLFISAFIAVFITGFLTLSAAAAASGAVEYGLDELLRLALERSEKIRLSEEDLGIAEAGKDRAFSALIPKASAFGEYRRYSEKKLSAAGQVLQPEATTTWGFRLDESMSLAGRELSALRISKGRVAKSGYDLAAVKEAYLFGVASAYFDVLKANKALGVAKSNMERLKLHKSSVEKRLKVGEVTKTALLRAEAELSGAESLLISAESRLSVSKAQLARLAGISGDYGLREPLEGEALTGGSIPVDLLKERAVSERAEIKSIEEEKRNVENQVRYASAAYWPTLSIEGVYSNKDDDPASASAVKESVYGGVRLTFSIFDGGLKRADVREAEARLRQAGLQLEDLKKTVAVEVETTYLDLMTKTSILKSLEDRLAFARDNYNAVSKQFEYGMATSIDVMDANDLLVTAELGFSEAALDRRLSAMRLERATGTFLKAVGIPAKK